MKHILSVSRHRLNVKKRYNNEKTTRFKLINPWAHLSEICHFSAILISLQGQSYDDINR